ncbi:hypothetical protein ABT275_45065 [Streptomyces sp. NPDC001185]|uniref:DinB/UmuC family translesion DNA polymerase n=1 Tax=Streptomyces sp. NPDC001185 TaxID=3154380 RepID=UPI003332F9E5
MPAFRRPPCSACSAPPPAAPSTNATSATTPPPSTPPPRPASISTEHRFTRDELDPATHRRALLALGTRLRTSGHRSRTCTIRYVDHTSTRRVRTLPEATQQTVLLARAAYALYETLGMIDRSPATRSLIENSCGGCCAQQ